MIMMMTMLGMEMIIMIDNHDEDDQSKQDNQSNQTIMRKHNDFNCCVIIISFIAIKSTVIDEGHSDPTNRNDCNDITRFFILGLR